MWCKLQQQTDTAGISIWWTENEERLMKCHLEQNFSDISDVRTSTPSAEIWFSCSLNTLHHQPGDNATNIPKSIRITDFPTNTSTLWCNNVRLSDVKWKGFLHTILNCSCLPIAHAVTSLGLHYVISFNSSWKPTQRSSQAATSPAWDWSPISRLHGLHTQVCHMHGLANCLQAEWW